MKNNTKKTFPLFGRQNGQAATEFLIASAFIMVPIFLIVPLLGKYIDIKHATIQRARYEAWEYTAWFGKKGDIPAGIKSDQSAGIKSAATVSQEGEQLFFSEYISGSTPLWTDHRGDLLTTPANLNSSMTISSPTPDLTKGVLGTLIKFVDLAFEFLGDVFSLLGVDNAKFDAINENGYFRSEISLTVTPLGEIIPAETWKTSTNEQTANLQFYASAAVLTNGWNAGGSDHAASETRGIVPTTLLDNPVLNGATDIAKKIFPDFPDPEWGKVDPDAIPREHLNPPETVTNDEKTGLCYYK